MQSQRFPLSESAQVFKYRLLNWSQRHSPVCFLDNNGLGSYGYPNGRVLLGVGQVRAIEALAGEHAFDRLRSQQSRYGGWWLGYLGYDLKNEIENLTSHHPDPIGFPDLHFFQPEHLFLVRERSVTILSHTTHPETLWEEVRAAPLVQAFAKKPVVPRLFSRLSRSEYEDRIQQIRHHIQRGDIYEMNFCQEFFYPSVQIQAAGLFRSLNDRAQTPFSTFYQWEDRYLLSASPERFLRKQGQKIISQPIKGTRQRGQTQEEDQRLRLELMHSHKDRSEHVMIVDLVRNDLARSCQTGSVKVPELYGIYAFEQVFQMISTVEGTLRSDQHLADAIRLAFPMGSMTGAPKVRAMKLIEELEVSRRGLYSGAVGYITPEGNVDFNVVIRSLLYRASSGYLSFQVGGAIVNDSDPAQEYEECLWKARAILETLGVSAGEITPASAG